MSAQIQLTLIPELESENFEWAIGSDCIFFKMKNENNWHTARPSTLISQLKTLHHEVQELKNIILQFANS
jgi:hypothetical protein